MGQCSMGLLCLLPKGESNTAGSTGRASTQLHHSTQPPCTKETAFPEQLEGIAQLTSTGRLAGPSQDRTDALEGPGRGFFWKIQSGINAGVLPAAEFELGTGIPKENAVPIRVNFQKTTECWGCRASWGEVRRLQWQAQLPPGFQQVPERLTRDSQSPEPKCKWL